MSLAYGCQRLFLRVDVVARRARLRDQQRALAVAREPDAVALVGPRLPSSRFVQQTQHLAGGIAGEHALQQECRRASRAAAGSPRARRAGLPAEKCSGVTAGAQQIAVAPEEIAVLLRARVSRRCRSKRSARRCAARAARRLLACASAPARAFDADQDEARDHAVAQLVDEDLLRGRGRARQESREIGGELGAGDDDRAREHEQQPRAGEPSARERVTARPR